jgi:hypothetical protein
VQSRWEDSSEWRRVTTIADALQEHLNTPAATALIHAANQPGESSVAVQKTFGAFARDLGFEDEKAGLVSSVELGLRPDYFLRMEDTGILLEVERGKTTINNMDLLDFWKCHLCGHAHYLFLLVPIALRQNSTMTPRNEYAAVGRRLGHFFKEANYTNVRGLCLFGY